MRPIEIIEYFPRVILLIYAVISSIGILWFADSLSIAKIIIGILLVVCATYIGLVRLQGGNNTHIIVAGLGALSSVYFAYIYWVRVVANDASVTRVIAMLFICSIFIYFAVSRFKVDHKEGTH